MNPGCCSHERAAPVAAPMFAAPPMSDPLAFVKLAQPAAGGVYTVAVELENRISARLFSHMERSAMRWVRMEDLELSELKDEP